MKRPDVLSVLMLLFVPLSLLGQHEQLTPLTVNPKVAQQSLRLHLEKSLEDTFIYFFDTLDVPFVDDFSGNKFHNFDASADEPGVVDSLFYRLLLDGSPFDENVMLDTTYSISYDISMPDTTIVDSVPNPSIQLTVNNLSAYPVVGSQLEVWPAYTIRDTIPGFGPDTQFIDLPDLVQEERHFYFVPPDGKSHWVDRFVYVNSTYPIKPPTVGVATFDGLDEMGYPYDFSDSQSYGIADHMTSVPIRLNYQPSDSVYLSFFFQSIGLSGDNVIQIEDSLVLEFFDPNTSIWSTIWSTHYFETGDFIQILIPIIETNYLVDNFQFRFKNYGSLSGSLDHWHLDYVRLGINRSATDTIIPDLAQVYEETTLLENYTAMPWKHYKLNPEDHMRDTVNVLLANNAIDGRLVSNRMLVEFEGAEVGNFLNLDNPSISGQTCQLVEHPILNAPNEFVFDTALADTCAVFDVYFATNATPDINRDNDTISFQQDFNNYYAYDDGSAEAAYGLNENGAELAYRFDVPTADTLRALDMYFNPSFENPEQDPFLITIWSSLDPEVIIHQNFSFSFPEYSLDGINEFTTYHLDSAVAVGTTYFVGWVQTTGQRLNIGFDKNNKNQSRIFYDVGSGWTNTLFEGSLLIRPVYVSDKDGLVSVLQREVPSFNAVVYPNPATDVLYFRTQKQGNFGVSLFDPMGKLIFEQSIASGSPIPLNDLNPGIYFLKINAGDTFQLHKVVVQ